MRNCNHYVGLFAICVTNSSGSDLVGREFSTNFDRVSKLVNYWLDKRGIAWIEHIISERSLRKQQPCMHWFNNKLSYFVSVLQKCGNAIVGIRSDAYEFNLENFIDWTINQSSMFDTCLPTSGSGYISQLSCPGGKLWHSNRSTREGCKGASRFYVHNVQVWPAQQHIVWKRKWFLDAYVSFLPVSLLWSSCWQGFLLSEFVKVSSQSSCYLAGKALHHLAS